MTGESLGATIPTMRPENLKAVEAIREKIRAREEEIRQWKIVVNAFYTDEDEAPPYPNVATETSASIGSLRTDHFYGKTLAEAGQIYLEMRKASGLGSASVNEIYDALKAGGYKFNAANDDYAKNGVRISLRKTPAIFHQLPNGDYGLSAWYGKTSQKETNNAHPKKKQKRGKRAPGAEKKQSVIAPKTDAKIEEAPPSVTPNGAGIAIGAAAVRRGRPRKIIGAAIDKLKSEEANKT